MEKLNSTTKYNNRRTMNTRYFEPTINVVVKDEPLLDFEKVDTDLLGDDVIKEEHFDSQDYYQADEDDNCFLNDRIKTDISSEEENDFARDLFLEQVDEESNTNLIGNSDPSSWHQVNNNGGKSKRVRGCPCLHCKINLKVFNSVGKKLHQCTFDNCSRQFLKTSHLKSHLRWHVGDKPYECNRPGCDKKFIRSDELQRHERTHTGEKRFECSFCPKRFMRADHLHKHEKIHTNNKRSKNQYGKPLKKFPCTECDTICPSSELLLKHVYLHERQRLEAARKYELLQAKEAKMNKKIRSMEKELQTKLQEKLDRQERRKKISNS